MVCACGSRITRGRVRCDRCADLDNRQKRGIGGVAARIAAALDRDPTLAESTDFIAERLGIARTTARDYVHKWKKKGRAA